MPRGYYQARTNRLLSEVVIQDALLNALHDLRAKVTNHGQIHACIHQAKGIPGGDDAIKGRQFLKSTADNLHLGVLTELPSQDIGKLSPSIYENQFHGNEFSADKGIPLLASGHLFQGALQEDFGGAPDPVVRHRLGSYLDRLSHTGAVGF